MQYMQLRRTFSFRSKKSLNSVYRISHLGIDMYNIYYSVMKKMIFLVTMLFIYVGGYGRKRTPLKASGWTVETMFS